MMGFSPGKPNPKAHSANRLFIVNMKRNYDFGDLSGQKLGTFRAFRALLLRFATWLLAKELAESSGRFGGILKHTNVGELDLVYMIDWLKAATTGEGWNML